MLRQTGCYDRIVNLLIILFLKKLGVPSPVVDSLAQTWQETAHRIKTLYGISNQQYQNSLAFFLFGPGQGSTIGPLLWLICFLLIVHSIHHTTPAIQLKSADRRTTYTSRGDAFVDDAGLGCTMEFPQNVDTGLIQQSPSTLVTNLQALAQRWERLLFSTGGH